MEFIPRITEIIARFGYVEGKAYRCTQFVEHLKTGLGFTPEIVFKDIENSQFKYLDMIGVFLTRFERLEPINYGLT